MRRNVFVIFLIIIVLSIGVIQEGGCALFERKPEEPLILPGKIVFQSDRQPSSVYQKQDKRLFSIAPSPDHPKSIKAPVDTFFSDAMEATQSQTIYLLENGAMVKVAEGVLPRLTHNGGKVIYRGENYTLHVLDLATQKEEILEWSGQYTTDFFDLAPNGKTLVFRSDKLHYSKYRTDAHPNFKTANFFITSLDGSDIKQITDFPGNTGAGDPQWSPDGTRILFVVRLSSESDDEDLKRGLYTIAPDGSNLKKFPIPRELNPWYAGWSPKGDKIVFVGKDSLERDQIYLFDIKTEVVTQLTKNEQRRWFYADPLFSPFGTQILFECGRKKIPNPHVGSVLFVINLDGTDERQVTPYVKIKKYGRTRWGTDIYPDWAP